MQPCKLGPAPIPNVASTATHRLAGSYRLRQAPGGKRGSSAGWRPSLPTCCSSSTHLLLLAGGSSPVVVLLPVLRIGAVAQQPLAGFPGAPLPLLLLLLLGRGVPMARPGPAGGCLQGRLDQGGIGLAR